MLFIGIVLIIAFVCSETHRYDQIQPAPLPKKENH